MHTKFVLFFLAGWGPYAYFNAVEELRSSTQAQHQDAINTHGMNNVVDSHLDSTFDALESGRK